MEEKEKNEELARLQKIIEEVEEWGYGRIEIEIADNVIIIAKCQKSYKFNNRDKT
jgi:hypothetical protein